MAIQIIMTISIAILLIICSVLLYNLVNKYLNIKEREDLFNRFIPVLSIIENAKDTAYKKVFNNIVLPHASSGYKLGNKEIKIAQRDYLKMVFDCCGEKVVSDIEQIYGNIEAFSVVILNEFVEKVLEEEGTITTNVEELEKLKNSEGSVNFKK